MADDGVGTSDHFRTGGLAYARHRPTYPALMAAFLADLAPARDIAVDVGCGSGQLAHLLATCFNQVEAFDVSEDQIAHAIAHQKVRYSVAPAERLTLGSSTASLITAAQAAHWFDLQRFYDEVRRIAVPDAVLALVSYGVPTVEGPLADRFRRFYWHNLADYWPAERRHVEAGYTDMPFPFSEITAPPFQIQRLWQLNTLLGYFETWSAVKRARAKGENLGVDAFIDDARRLWGTPDIHQQITWPIRMRLGRV